MHSFQLRSWQREAYSCYLEALSAGTRTLLWEATPGAGKTSAALLVVKHQLKTRLAQSALIVVPTAHLRIQWARAAAQFGIDLDSNFGGKRTALAKDFRGAVMTYQQLESSSATIRALARNAVVILDEVHHAADGRSWGNALRKNLESAPFILCLSGTAFRSDCNAIPFVEYDKEGLSQPNYAYTYARAVEDGVCRPTAFFTFGGEVTWSEQDKVYSANFHDTLDPLNSARRLRAALEAETGWIEPMVREAHQMLLTTRRAHPHAGALMVCADQSHARQMARLLQACTGEKPTVVLSEDSSASKKIKAFSDDRSHWLVACNMVSEGVDIPRLRVGVYATTIKTKMYFRQFLGRIVRRQPQLSGPQVAYLFLPSDPTLHRLAEEIEGEIRHCLFRKTENPYDETEQSRAQSEPHDKRSWSALHGVNSGLEAVLLHGNQLSLFGGTLEPQELQETIHREMELRQEQSLTRSEVKQRLATEIKHLVAGYHRNSGKSHSVIHTLLNHAQAVRSQTHCTEQQLRDRIGMLEELMEKAARSEN